MTFTKKFLTNSCDPNELEEKDLEKILKKKIIHIWNEIIAVLIAEKEKFSMLLILKAIFEDSISNYFLYKILSFIYKFEKRGTWKILSFNIIDLLISFISLIPDFNLLDNLLLLIAKLEKNKSNYGEINIIADIDCK